MRALVATIASSRRRVVGLLAAVVVAVMASGLAGLALASDGEQLPFTWSMADRFGLDENDDGLVDYPISASYVKPATWAVTFDACAAPAAQGAPSGSTFHLSLTQGSSTVTAEGGCELDVDLPKLDAWNATLQLRDADGSVIDSSTQTITPKDHFIVSLGDSVGSGEGVPDKVGPRSDGAFPFYGAVWQDRQCHRSAMAGSAQGALRLERRDPHSSVTFIHLACSGATIDVGILGEYEGIEPDAGYPMDPQLEAAIELARGRKIDAMVISIGANNAKFSTIVKSCLLFTNCHNFTNIPNEKNAQQIYDESIGTLAPLYAQMDDAIDALQRPGQEKVGKVFLTQYFDPSTQDNGDWCDGLTPRERAANRDPDGIGSDGVTQPEWEFASQTVVTGLNEQVQAAVEASDDDGGRKWAFVDGIAPLFEGHGYCAADRWVRTLFESFSYQQNKDGAFHPNIEGHLYGYATRVEAVVGEALGVEGDPLPVEPDPNSELVGEGLNGFLGSLERADVVEHLQNLLPFGGREHLNAGWQKVFEGLDWVQTKVNDAVVQYGDSLTSLDNALDDLNGDGDTTDDVDVDGLKIDVDVEIGPHAPAAEYDVVLSVKAQLDGADTTLEYLADALSLDGAPLDGGVLFDLDVPFKIRPGLPERGRITIPANGVSLGSLGFSVDADLGATDEEHPGDTEPLEFNVGLVGARATGTIHADSRVAFRFVDPNNDGGIDATEIGSALFRMSCASEGGAQLDLNVRSSFAGLENEVGRITLDDRNLCDGITTPDLQLAGIGDFRSITIADFVSGLAQLTTMLDTIQQSGDVDIPFVQGGLSKFVEVNRKLVKFFVDNGLTDPNNPLSSVQLDPSRTDLDTLQELVPVLAEALGLPVAGGGEGATTAAVDGGLDVRWSNGKLLFDFELEDDLSPVDDAELDFGDQLDNVGLVGLAGSASANIDAEYDLDLTLGVDLAPGLDFADRFYFGTGGLPQLELDAEVTADLDLTGRVALFDVNVKDTAEGPVTLLKAKEFGEPILKVELDGGDDDRLTVAELSEAVARADFPADITINGTVPPTTLDITSTLGGQPLAGGKVTVSWPDLSKLTGPGSLSVTADDTYVGTLLPFSYDPENPRASIGQFLTALRNAVVSVQGVVTSDPELVSKLPLIGRSVADLDPVLGDVRAALDALISANQSLTLSQIEAEAERVLADALGIEGEEARASILTLSLTPATSTQPAALTAALNLGICTDGRDLEGCTATVPAPTAPFNLSLGSTADAPGVAGIGSDGSATIGFDARAQVTAGVNLPKVVPAAEPGGLPTVVGTPAPFLVDTSNLEIGVSAAVDGVVTATLGPAEISLGSAGDHAQAGVAARYRLAGANPTGARLVFGSPAFATWVDSLDPNPGTGIHDPDRAPTCPGVTGTNDACAGLPVYIGDTKVGDVTFTAPDLLTPSGWTVEETVTANIASSDFAFGIILDGLRGVSQQLADALENVPDGTTLPLIGADISAGADILRGFDEQVLVPAQNLVNELRTLNRVSLVQAKVQEFFAGVPMLRDTNGNGPDPTDVTIITECRDAEDEAVRACTPTDALTKLQRFEVHVPLGQSLTAEPTFDAGFPGLRLATESPLSASVGFELDLKFGIDRTNGFYIPTAGTAPELRLQASAGLPEDEGTDMEGEIAFLPILIDDLHPGHDVEVKAGIDLTGGGADGRLTLQQLGTADIIPSISACANVQLGLELTAPDDAQSKLPQLVATLLMQGGYSCDGAIGAPPGTTFGIRFQDVRVDLGSMISDFIRPAVKEIRRFTKPLEPTVDALNKPIPGVAQAARMAGRPAPTWMQLLHETNNLNRQRDGRDGLQLITRIGHIVTLTRTLDSAAGQEGFVPLGGFEINVQAARSPVSGDQAQQLLGALNLPDGRSVMDRLGDHGLEVEVNEALLTARRGGGFTFPAFDEPSKLFQLLIGKDVPLVKFDAGYLGVERGFSFNYPIGPFRLYLAGGAKLEGRFVAGYDTFGVRRAFQILSDDDPGNDDLADVAAGLVQGFYIDDLDDEGADVPEIRFDAHLTAGAGVGVKGLSVNAEGSIVGFAELNLKDEDGRVRFEDIAAQYEKNPNPVCFFDGRARISARIKAVLNTFLGDISYPIADVVIFDRPDLTAWCEQPPDPGRTGRVESDGTLILATTAGPDVYVVNSISAGKVIVARGDGVLEEFNGVTRVFADGKDGADHIVVGGEDGTPPVPAFLCGGAGMDSLTAQSGLAWIYGDAGPGIEIDDVLVPCAPAGPPEDSDDSIVGSPHGDVLDGGLGTDLIEGGDGADNIKGGGGDDTIVGGLGTDTIDGGDGDDVTSYTDRSGRVEASLPGPSGEPGTGEADVTENVEGILGGAGNDRLVGADAVNTRLDGGAGDDEITGAKLSDLLFGGDGGDVLAGGEGFNTIFGDAGDDRYAAGPGGDTFFGGPGVDTADYRGVDGPVTLLLDGLPNDGEAGAFPDNIHDADVILGTADDDLIVGGAPDERIEGGEGHDRIDGGGGVDEVIGGGGDDLLGGGAGDDRLVGGLGDDSLEGGPGADSLRGNLGWDTADYSQRDGGVRVDLSTPGRDGDALDGPGDDVVPDIETILGGSGADRLTGDGWDQRFVGGEGADVIIGGGGDDGFEGGPGDDVLLDSAATAFGVDDGVDVFTAGDGHDMVAAQGGDDRLEGGAGNDRLIGGAGVDTILGSVGEDALLGAGGADVLGGELGNDVLDGGPGPDAVRGDGGDDDLIGGDGPDTLLGGEGADVLTGGFGLGLGAGADEADTLTGEVGNDRAFGGGGNDVFRMGRLSDGADEVRGGPGDDDAIDYGSRTEAVSVTANLTADDGELDERDDVYGDVERVMQPGSGQADLAVSVAADPALGEAGSPLTWTITVVNHGPGDAPSVVVRSELPVGVALDEVLPAVGTCSVAGRVVTCTVPTLEAGEETTIDVVVVPSASGTVRNAVSVESPLDDPDPSDNSSFVDTVVQPDPGAAGPVAVAIGDGFVVEGGVLELPVTLNRASTEPVHVTWTAAAGTASPGDFVPAGPVELVFLPGETEQVVEVATIADVLSEREEAITLRLSQPVGAVLGDTIATGRIADDDLGIRVSIDDAHVVESDGPGELSTVVRLNRAPVSGEVVSVRVRSVDGRALTPTDYAAVDQVLTFAAGEEEKPVTVPIVGDDAVERSESFRLALSEGVGLRGSDTSATATIVDDDGTTANPAPNPGVSVGDAAVLEGGTLRFPVRLDRPAPAAVTVAWSAALRSLAADDVAGPTTGSVVIPAGETAAVIEIATTSDGRDEATEGLTVTIGSAPGAVIADRAAAGVVYDDDSPIIVYVDDTAGIEGGEVTFTLRLSRAAAAGEPFSVQASTVDNTAKAAADYVAVDDTVTFGVGVTEREVVVELVGDAVEESSERLALRLSAASGGRAGDAVAYGTVGDDD